MNLSQFNQIRKHLQRPKSALVTHSRIRQFVITADRKAALIVEQVKKGKGGEGYNVATDKFEDLIASGVVDLTKVTRTALQNAASISGMLLTAELHQIRSRPRRPGRFSRPYRPKSPFLPANLLNTIRILVRLNECGISDERNS